MEVMCEILCVNKFDNVYICLLVYVGNVGFGVCLLVGIEMDLMIVVFFWGVYFGEEVLENGVDVMVLSWYCVVLNIILIVVKVGGNYLFFLLVGGEVCCYGYVEGIVLSVDGYFFEGVGENIFVVKNGVILILLIISFILLGIICDLIMMLVCDMGYEVCEVNIFCEVFYLVDEIFMIGIVVEVVFVCSVDKIIVGVGKCGFIIKVV